MTDFCNIILITILLESLIQFNTVSIGKFYLTWWPLVKQIYELEKIVGCIRWCARAPLFMLLHYGPVTLHGRQHLANIDIGYALSRNECKTITWTDTGLLSIRPSVTKFCEIRIKYMKFYFTHDDS